LKALLICVDGVAKLLAPEKLYVLNKKLVVGQFEIKEKLRLNPLSFDACQ
jgi:hypothetical protein